MSFGGRETVDHTTLSAQLERKLLKKIVKYLHNSSECNYLQKYDIQIIQQLGHNVGHNKQA